MQRHYFAYKGPSSQSYVFSSSHVWMWELDHKESWAPKNWYFWTVVLEKTLENPLISQGESNQSILKEINPEYSLEELMLKLKLQYLGHLMQKANSLEKMLGKTESKRRRGWQRIRWLDSITNSMNMNLSKLWDIVENRGAWLAAVHGVAKSQLSDRTTRAAKYDLSGRTEILLWEVSFIPTLPSSTMTSLWIRTRVLFLSDKNKPARTGCSPLEYYS